MSDPQVTKDEPKSVQKTTTIGLYPEDKAAVEYIRERLMIDSFGQAVRVAIRTMAEKVKREEREAA